MGLFSRRRSSTDDDVLSNNQLYVLIRYTDAAQSPSTTWSLAVSEKTVPHQHDHTDEKSSKPDRTKKPFFTTTTTTQQDSTSGSDSQTDSIAESSSRTSTTPAQTLHESHLAHTTQHPTTLLLKILLPVPTNKPKRKQPPLSAQLKQIRAANQADESWLHTSLTQLQASHHLPQPPSFNVTKFLDFARNRLAACRGEGGGGDDVEVVDYAAHLVENERLRAHFGHGGAEDEEEREREQRGGGRWRVSWPMAEEGDRGRDVYAGLM